MIKANSGFTLIELMVVVSIIGILSAVTAPQFNKFQEKAKLSEALVNMGALRKAEIAYYAEHGNYVGIEDHGGLDDPRQGGLLAITVHDTKNWIFGVTTIPTLGPKAGIWIGDYPGTGDKQTNQHCAPQAKREFDNSVPDKNMYYIAMDCEDGKMYWNWVYEDHPYPP